MKRLKAIWYILTCDNFFLGAYYNGCYTQEYYTYDTIKYIHPKFDKYFADAIKDWIKGIYENLPQFK